MPNNIKKVIVYLVIALNFMLPLNIFAQELEKGQGSLKEAVKNMTKEFYTIKTPNEKTYYLVIDFSKNEENVFFLKEVEEEDLIHLAKSKIDLSKALSQKEIVEDKINTEVSEPEVIKIEQPKKKLDIMSVVAIIGLIALGVFLIYDKFIKNTKNNTKFNFDEEEDDIIDGIINKKNKTEEDDIF